MLMISAGLVGARPSLRFDDLISYAPANAAGDFTITVNQGNITGLKSDGNNLTSLQISRDVAETLATLDIEGNTVMPVSEFPAKVTVLKLVGIGTAFTFPTVPSGVVTLWCTDCVLSALPALPNGLIALDCSVNTIASLPASLPVNLTTLLCNDNGMNAAAVNAVLASLVANGKNNGTLDISGSNAAPTGQGATDKTTLQGRGWTVTTT